MSEIRKIIERIYDHVESGSVDKAVFCCLRLAKNMGDAYSTVLFLRELTTDEKQLEHAVYDEVEHLKEDAQSFVWKSTFEHWSEGRDLKYSLSGEADKTLLVLGVGELQKDVVQLKDRLFDLNIPDSMGEYDSAAFTDRYDQTKVEILNKIRATNTILERIRTRCLNYASRIEKQLNSQVVTTLFLGEVQTYVNLYFSNRSDETFRKLNKSLNLIGSKSPEDHALLLTSVRRAINCVADYFYPPASGEVVCSDGVSRKMGKDQYLNRLQEFCMTKFSSSTSKDLVKAELDYLIVFARKLNDIASKGVHSEVSLAEAKQGLVGLYLFLFNLINKLENGS